ncbi:MAG: COQ9 family protein [Neomegalonema sp.]|nr:COQ9 family protein [Neomegalonema sp.]
MAEETVNDDPIATVRDRVLAAALPLVPFDGWSQTTLDEAVRDAGVDPHEAKLAFPRGGVDLAVAFHRQGDAQMIAALSAADLAAMRIRDRVAFAVRTRLEIAAPYREAVRKGSSLFALPIYASDGARCVWETADHIWTALGDPSEDLNWYTKRTILAGVYSATVLYWLGDESEDFQLTWEFLDRRIEGVMQFEKMKAAVNNNPFGRLMMMAPNWLAAKIRKPNDERETGTPVDLPGGSMR